MCPDAQSVSMLKSVKLAKSPSFCGLLSVHQAQYLSALNNVPLVCGLPEEPVTDVTQHAQSAKMVPMTVNSASLVGSCTKKDATRTVHEVTMKMLLTEHAFFVHRAASTVSMQLTARHANQANDPTKAHATIHVRKAPMSKDPLVLIASAHVKIVAAPTTVQNADHHTSCSRVNADSNALPLII